MKLLPQIDLPHRLDAQDVVEALKILRERQSNVWYCNQTGGEDLRELPRFLGAGAAVHVGGHVLHMTEVQRLLDLGAKRVVVGKQALGTPQWLHELVYLFPHAIGLRLRVMAGVVENMPVGGWDVLDKLVAAVEAVYVSMQGHVDASLLARLRKHAKTLYVESPGHHAILEENGVDAAIVPWRNLPDGICL